jgi:hypothetical protein
MRGSITFKVFHGAVEGHTMGCGLVGAVRAMTGWCTRLRVALPWAIGVLSPPPPQGTPVALFSHIPHRLAMPSHRRAPRHSALWGGPRPPASTLGRGSRGHQQKEKSLSVY